MGKNVPAVSRIGTIIKNFKILKYKRENKRSLYYVRCQLCGKCKWMRVDTEEDALVVQELVVDKIRGTAQ